MNRIVSFSNVAVCFGDHQVIQDFSFELNEGDFAALIGSNGSGKTTILRVILGFLRVSAGELQVFGEPVMTRALRTLRKRTGYVAQTPALDFRMPMSVSDVVAIGRCGRRGLGQRLSRHDRDMIRQSLEDMKIGHLADRPIGHMSGGERQKVHIARALCQEPDLLLLDEPTSNLDLGAQHECLDLICRIQAERRLTTLIVMHDLEALPKTCNRAMIIDKGRKKFDGQFTSLFAHANLSHIYKHITPFVMQALNLPAESEQSL